MRTPIHILSALVAVPMIMVSCSTMQDATGERRPVRDDVYYMPSEAPPAAARSVAPAEGTTADDYFDAGQADAYTGPRGYYDLAYNDPYYYNYGRFGFGMGVGMGMGSMGWYNPMGGVQYGWGMYHQPYWYDGYYGPWGRPWWMYNMGPGYYSMYDPYGIGPYYGPWGSCYGCYLPVVIGDVGGNVYTGHRRSLNAGPNNVGAPGGGAQGRGRDLVSLDQAVRQSAFAPSSASGRRGVGAVRGGQDVAHPLNNGSHGRFTSPTGQGQQGRQQVETPRQQPRTAPRLGGGDGGNMGRGGSIGSGSGGRSLGGGSTPSGGGGGRSSGSGRPR